MTTPSWSVSVDVYTSDTLALLPDIKVDTDALNALKFFLNQSMVRDGYEGCWVEAFFKSKNDHSTFTIRCGSPTKDVAPFAAMVKKFLTEGQTALATYKASIDPATYPDWAFCLPWGLPLLGYQAVQLLHFPPTNSATYYDYMYAKTNSRYEALLAENGLTGEAVRLQERIVDLLPIAAPSGDGEKLDTFFSIFGDYVKAMLRLFLDNGASDSGFTVPVVAGGGSSDPTSTQPAVRGWLQQTFQADIYQQLGEGHLLQVGDLFFVQITTDGVRKTPIMITNHPSAYMYNTDKPIDAAKITMMRQDLQGSGWNVVLAKNPDTDPAQAKQLAVARWANDADVKAVCECHDAMFSGFGVTVHPFGP